MEKEKDLDVIDQYKNITNKLKKKFLKKPNLAEGSEQFETLARQQKADDNPQYAGMCFLAQARCEQSLGNWTAEATALYEAAKSFIKAHDFFHRTHCVSFLEDLHSAINCYGHAIRVNNENGQWMVAAQMCIELGKHLKRFGKTTESIQHFQRAVELLKDTPQECLQAMDLLASSKIESSEYEGALTTYTDMFNLAKKTAIYHTPNELENTCKDMLRHCEINMLLLLLYLEPSPLKTSQQHSRLLEKYTWDVQEKYLETFCSWVVCESGLQAAEEEHFSGKHQPMVPLAGSHKGGLHGEAGKTGEMRNYMSLELFFALQSLAMACQEAFEEDILSGESDLQRHLNAAQKQLTRLVVLHHTCKSERMMRILAS